MKTIKFIGCGIDYANVMTEEGESICKLRFGKDAFNQRIINGRLYLYLEGNDDEPVGVFAKRFYYCENDAGSYVEVHDVLGKGRYAYGKGITGEIYYTKEREVCSTLIKRNGILLYILVEYKKSKNNI